MPGQLASELALASRLAREAGAVIEQVRERGFSARAKADSSPVTDADLAADALIRAGLTAAFPADGVLSEESGDSPGPRRPRTWIVDPLDGTEAFVDGVTRGYAVQIGLLDGLTPVLGVVYEPHEDRLMWAVRGHGTYLEHADEVYGPLRVSARVDLATMPLLTSVRIAPALRGRLLTVGLPDAGALHSVGVKVGALVCGTADVYVSEHPISHWDSCAPLVLLEEAGGVLTQLDGSPFSYAIDPVRGPRHPGPLVASNGPRHADLCAAFRAVWDPA